MKKGVFGGWFREFATLVFTQTVQAFLLAIVMTIIISATKGKGEGQNTYAAGLLAIIALSQFNKIELLVKQIFGVTSQYGPDMASGKSGLLGGMMALRGAKHMANNVGKVIGGAGRIVKSQSDINRLRKQRAAMASGEEAMAAEGAADDAEFESNLSYNNMNAAADKAISGAAAGAGAVVAADAVSGGNSGLGVSSAQIDSLIQAINRQTDTIKNSDNGGKSLGSGGKESDKLKAIDDQIAAAKMRRTDSIRSVVSGFAETGAALGGMALGAAVGAATGDGIAKTAIAGGGIADKAVSSASVGVVNTARGIKSYRENTIGVKRDILDAKGKKIGSERVGGKDQYNAQIASNMSRRDSADARRNKAEYNKKIYDATTKKIGKLEKTESNPTRLAQKVNSSRDRAIRNVNDL